MLRHHPEHLLLMIAFDPNSRMRRLGQRCHGIETILTITNRWLGFSDQLAIDPQAGKSTGSQQQTS